MKKIIISICILIFLFNVEGTFPQMSNAGRRIRQIQGMINSRRNSRPQNRRNNTRRNSRSNRRTPVRIKLYKYKLKVFLANNNIIAGAIVTKKKLIQIIHYKNGIRFNKVLKLKKIKSIEIIKFKSLKYRSNSKMVSYYFTPYEYKIVDKKGNIYYYKKPIKFLYSLRIVNEAGTARLKSFYIDYWLKNKNCWYYSKSRKFNFPILNPQPKTVIKIVFIRD